VPKRAAPPALPVVPVALPVEAVQTPAALHFNSTPDMVVPRTRRQADKGRKRRLIPLLAVLAVVALGLGVAVWGSLWLLHFQKIDQAEQDPSRAAGVFSARFPLLAAPWKSDNDIRLKLHVHIGMRSSESNNCMGLAFRDYKTRMPGDAELVDEALGKLRSYFQNLEWERKPPDEKVQLGGRPALVFEFQGEDAEHIPMNGECYTLAYRGYAYWFFTWAPLQDKERLSPEWSELRQQFSLLDGRKGWTAKPRDTEKVQGTKAKYRLAYVKGLWTPVTAGDYDDAADLVFQGDEPDVERRRHASKAAILQVLVLPKQENLKAAVAAARDYLQKREEKDYPKTTFEALKDKNGAVIDQDTKVGDGPGHLSKFRVRNTEDRERFLVAVVLNRPEGVLVLVGDCLWDRRDFWDQEFTPLIDSLKVR
jgi:hypothetical protein